MADLNGLVLSILFLFYFLVLPLATLNRTTFNVATLGWRTTVANSPADLDCNARAHLKCASRLKLSVFCFFFVFSNFVLLCQRAYFSIVCSSSQIQFWWKLFAWKMGHVKMLISTCFLQVVGKNSSYLPVDGICSGGGEVHRKLLKKKRPFQRRFF